MTTHTSTFDVEFNDAITNQTVKGFQMEYSEFFEGWVLRKNGIMAGYLFDSDMKRIRVIRQVA